MEEISLPKDAKLIVLTSTMSVTGTHEKDHGKPTQRYNQVYSNEFTNFKEDIVKVCEKDKLDNTKITIAEGVYSPTIKEKIADLPYASFTKNLYCLYDGEVVKVSLKGSSLTPWIQFENDLRENGEDIMHGLCFYVDGATAQKNGSVSYSSPVYKKDVITSDQEEEANKLANEVEEAILRNKQANGTEEPVAKVEVSKPAAEDGEIALSDIPF